MSTMKAIVINGTSASVDTNRPIPQIRPDYILVKVHSVALNPTDWKSIANNLAGPGCVSGCDYAGTVVEIGSKVTKNFKVGDRVFGVSQGANPSDKEGGVFAEYAIVKGDLQMKIPDNVSFEQASTLALGAFTVGQGLYQKALKLNLPTNPVTDETPVLIYGGSTATGSLGVQYAKLSGYKVYTTSSPRNTSFVQSLGADKVYDHNDSTIGSQIRTNTNNNLQYAWDTISLSPSAQICSDALSSTSQPSNKCRYGTILPVTPPRDDLDVTMTLMYTIFGEEFERGGKVTPASREDFEFARMFAGLTESLLAEGKLKTHPEEVRSGGLQGVLEGLDDLKAGKVSGKKLVYRVAETS